MILAFQVTIATEAFLIAIFIFIAIIQFFALISAFGSVGVGRFAFFDAVHFAVVSVSGFTSFVEQFTFFRGVNDVEISTVSITGTQFSTFIGRIFFFSVVLFRFKLSFWLT